jgi:hypothetical protein
MKKVVFIIILLILFTAAAYADVGVNAFLQQQVRMHENASVKKMHLEAEPALGLIIIEDAHCNLPVQREQMKIIRTINDRLNEIGLVNSPMVMQEGGSYGLIDTSIIKEGKGSDELDEYLAEKLKQGQIGAAEFLHVKYGGFDLAGIEDSALYAKNYDTFIALSQQQTTIETIIGEIDGMLKGIRELVFTQALKEFYDGQYRALADATTLDTYLDEIEVLVLQYSVDMTPYPSCKKLFDVIDALKALDAAALKAEQVALSRARQGDVTEEIIIQMYRKEQLTVADYPGLFKYARLKELLLKADMLSYLIEKDALEDELLKKVAFTEEEQELILVLKELETLRKMLTLQLTRSEYDYFIKERLVSKGNLAGNVLQYVCSYYTQYETELTLAGLYGEAEAFYSAVNQRDDALVNNILSLMKEKNAKVATVVLGGFHTEGIIERLAGKGVSYVVLAPDSAIVDPNSMVKYHQVMQDFKDGVTE